MSRALCLLRNQTRQHALRWREWTARAKTYAMLGDVRNAMQCRAGALNELINAQIFRDITKREETRNSN
jgi:hypothetical protein